MSTIKSNAGKNNVWPPDSLEKFVKNIYANDNDLSTSVRETLERFIATENIDLKLSCQSLVKNTIFNLSVSSEIANDSIKSREKEKRSSLSEAITEF